MKYLDDGEMKLYMIHREGVSSKQLVQQRWMHGTSAEYEITEKHRVSPLENCRRETI